MRKFIYKKISILLIFTIIGFSVFSFSVPSVYAAIGDEVTSAHSTSLDINTLTSGTHTPSGTPTVVLMYLSWRRLSTSVISSVTCDGGAMTLEDNQTANDAADAAGIRQIAVYYSHTVNASGFTCEATWTGNVRGIVMHIVTLSGTHTSDAIRAHQAGFGTGSSPYTADGGTVSSAVGDYTYGGIVAADGGVIITSIAPNGGETEKNEDQGAGAGGHRAQLQFESGAATVNHQWTVTATGGTDGLWGSIIISIQPPVGGSQIKTIDGLAIASVKTIKGLAIASVKNRNGLTNQ